MGAFAYVNNFLDILFRFGIMVMRNTTNAIFFKITFQKN